MKTPSRKPGNRRLQQPGGMWIALVATGLLGLGCASNNVNPATARSGTGYVDVYAMNDAELSWGIDRLESDGGRKSVFSEFDPVKESILRLAFKPGHHRLSVTIINRPVLTRGTVEVEVSDGMVTPVSVTLVDVGTGQVLSKQTRVGTAATGRYGRSIWKRSQDTQLFRLQAEAGAPLPYQPKSQMPYAASSDSEPPGPSKP